MAIENEHDQPQEAGSSARRDLSSLRRRFAVPLVYVVVFFYLFGENIQPAPRIDLYESIVCRQYYASHGSTSGPPDGTPMAILDGQSCKIPAVQAQLALLTGLERLSSILPTVLAIPFSALADKYGRSLILSIALFGLFLEELWPFFVCWNADAMPIRLVWLHFIFNFIGGGVSVISTMFFVIVADIVPAESRTTVFFRIHAAGSMSAVLAYTLASTIMEAVNSWLAWTIGLISLLIATGAAMLIPNMNVKAVEVQASSVVIEDPRIADGEVITGEVDQTPPHNGAPITSSKDSKGDQRRLQDLIVRAARGLKHIVALIALNPLVALNLFLVLACQIGLDSQPLMMVIYISKRFGWSFAKANLLNSIEMIVELVTLLVIIPPLGHLLAKRLHVSAHNKDRLIGYFSALALGIGALLTGLAPLAEVAAASFAIMGMGSGMISVLRSLITDAVPIADVSAVYSLVTVMHVVGGAVAGPIYSGLYAAALREAERTGADVWLGLPFIVAAGLFVVVLVGLLGLVEKHRYEPLAGMDEETDGEVNASRIE